MGCRQLCCINKSIGQNDPSHPCNGNVRKFSSKHFLNDSLEIFFPYYYVYLMSYDFHHLMLEASNRPTKKEKDKPLC